MNRTRRLVFAAVCLALCLVLPFLTGNNRELGTLFSLMHLPVLLCGLMCGLRLGLLVGFTAPLLRSLMFGMPPMPIVAVPMAFELAAYGFDWGIFIQSPAKRICFALHQPDRRDDRGEARQSIGFLLCSERLPFYLRSTAYSWAHCRALSSSLS